MTSYHLYQPRRVISSLRQIIDEKACIIFQSDMRAFVIIIPNETTRTISCRRPCASSVKTNMGRGDTVPISSRCIIPKSRFGAIGIMHRVDTGSNDNKCRPLPNTCIAPPAHVNVNSFHLIIAGCV